MGLPVHLGMHAHSLCKVGSRLHIDLTGGWWGLWFVLLQLLSSGQAGEDFL
jgi:hypothetical protein